MTAVLSTLLVLASIGDTLKTVMGVVLGLAGMAVLLVGVIALADKAVQKGATAAILGVAMMAAGLWLTGAL
jgi:uncharacterized membrane protein